MLLQYLQSALDLAHYELIDDEEPFYGEVKGLDGVWATGETLEKCRKNLKTAVEGWLSLGIAQGFLIPSLGNASLAIPTKIAS